MSCYSYVHLVKHWHYIFVYTNVLSNKDNIFLPLTLTPFTLNYILEIFWIVKHRIVLTRTITNSFYYFRWIKCFWFATVISYITTCALEALDYSPLLHITFHFEVEFVDATFVMHLQWSMYDHVIIFIWRYGPWCNSCTKQNWLKYNGCYHIFS